jgi:hypothetical protein
MPKTKTTSRASSSPKTSSIEPSQLYKFKEAARDLQTDDSEEHFDERLKRIAKAPPPKGDKPKDNKPGR